MGDEGGVASGLEEWNQDQLAENVAGADVTLSQDDLDRGHEILPHGAFGGRYPAALIPQR